MPGISAEFWRDLFTATQEALREVIEAHAKFQSSYPQLSNQRQNPAETAFGSNPNDLLNNVIQSGTVDGGQPDYACDSYVAFQEYIGQVRAGFGAITELLPSNLQASLILQLDIIQENAFKTESRTVASFQGSGMGGETASKSQKRRIASSPAFSTAPSTEQSTIQAWAESPRLNTSAAQQALTSIVSNSTLSKDEAQALTTNNLVTVREDVKSEFKHIFTKRKDLVKARRYVSMVSGTYSFDQRLEALEKMAEIFKSHGKISTLTDIIKQLYAESKIHTSRALEELYNAKTVEIEKCITALYDLGDAQDSLAGKVAKKFSSRWSRGVFGYTAKYQAIHQYTNASVSASTEHDKAVIANEFDQALERSKATDDKKRPFIFNLTAVEESWSPEIAQIAETADVAYKDNILQILSELYLTENSNPGGQQATSSYSAVQASTSANVLGCVKKACGRFFPTWTTEYMTAKQLVDALEHIPIKKDNIKKLTDELLVIWNKKSGNIPDKAKIALAKLNAVSRCSAWTDTLTSAMQTEERKIITASAQEQADKHFAASNAYLVQLTSDKSPGYPSQVGRGKEDCDFFISKIFEHLTKVPNCMEDVAARNLITKVSQLYVANNQNVYFVIMLLGLQFLKTESRVAEFFLLKNLLVVCLTQKSNKYVDELDCLKAAESLQWLTQYLPASLDLSSVNAKDLTEVRKIIDPAGVAAEEKAAADKIAEDAAIAAQIQHEQAREFQAKFDSGKLCSTEIDTLDNDKFADYAETCAQGIVSSTFSSGIKTFLTKDIMDSYHHSAPKSTILSYTLWEWYKTSTKGGKTIYRVHKSDTREWQDFQKPLNAFMALSLEALHSGGTLPDWTRVQLPQKDGPKKNKPEYMYTGASLQKLVDTTKTIFPTLGSRLLEAHGSRLSSNPSALHGSRAKGQSSDADLGTTRTLSGEQIVEI